MMGCEMEKNRCRICFAPMQQRGSTCLFCGKPDGAGNSLLDGWYTGMELEKRYTLGGIYKRNVSDVIWRAFDRILDIQCLLVRQVKSIFSDQVAKLDLAKAESEGCKILGYRLIAGEPVLILSLADKRELGGQFRLQSFLSDTPGRRIDSVNILDEQPNVLPTNTILQGTYRVIAPVGIGGFGITYLCEDINLGRNVAIKEYYPMQWVQRKGTYVCLKAQKYLQPFRYGIKAFEKEMKLTALFLHESSIVTIYDGFQEMDTSYIVLEYLEGMSIGRTLRRRKKPFSAEEWQRIWQQIIQGLYIMHQQGVLHGDISPGNILYHDDGKAKLIDLGAAKEWRNHEPTMSATFLKPDYASPEQYQTAKTGQIATEGPWSDVYSLGATTYFCLTGRRPPDILQRLQEGQQRIVFTAKERMKIPKKWRNIILQCLELDYHKRPQSVEELAQI